MGRLGVIGCVLMAFAVPGDQSTEHAPKGPPGPALSVRIVPDRFQEKTGRVLERGFHVVITNVSGQPLRLCCALVQLGIL